MTAGQKRPSWDFNAELNRSEMKNTLGEIPAAGNNGFAMLAPLRLLLVRLAGFFCLLAS